jgi:hypothetical protein
MASQMQGVLDKMADAHDAHTEALDDLKGLVGMGADAGEQFGLPDNLASIEDMDPTQYPYTGTMQYGPGSTPDGGGNGTQPTSGVIGRGQQGKGDRSVEMGEGGALDGTIKAGLANIQGILTDLMGTDAEENEADVEGQAVGMGITEDAIGPGRSEDPESRGRRILELRKALRGPEYDRLRKVLRQVEDGRRYRRLACTELVEWGVRAQGDAFASELYRGLLGSMTTEQVEELTRQFKDQAYKRFANLGPGELPEWFHDTPLAARVGRQTIPAATNRQEPPSPKSAAAAGIDIQRFKTGSGS